MVASRAMRLGNLDLNLVGDGTFRLDGGAMFGVVPKVLWERKKPADDRNRIEMASNSLLVAHGDDLVLIDTGIGDKNDERFRDLFGLGADAVRLPEQIRAAGYAPEDVTHVVLTHLHFDHCGWNARETPSGNLVPTFPKARYWLARGEVEHARAPNARDAASYDPRNWEPLFDAGQVELFDDEAAPIAGVRAIRAAGHNADMCIVRLDGGGPDQQAIFLADLVPTVAHVPVPWVMGFDLFPLQTMENKTHWLQQAAAGQWLCIFQHESETPVGRLVEERPGRYRAVPETDVP